MANRAYMSPGEERYWQGAHRREMYRIQQEEAASDEEYFRDLDEMKAEGFKGTHREWKAIREAEWKKIMGEAIDEAETESLAASAAEVNKLLRK